MATFARKLHWWSMVHAAALLGATGGTVLTDSLTPLLLIPSLTFTVLIGMGLWVPSIQSISLPNGVTGLRFVSILGLFWLTATTAVNGYILALGGLGLLLSDALDGWLARHYQSKTNIGALFDEEVDAFFLLALCVAAATSDRLGDWILVPGLLRYGFVLLQPMLDRRDSSTEIRSQRARILFVVMVLAMLTTLLPLPALYIPAAIGGFGLLTISFLLDGWILLTAKPCPLSDIMRCVRKLLLSIRGRTVED